MGNVTHVGCETGGMTAQPPLHRPLWWRVVAVNLAIFAIGTALLALTPATVSQRPVASEVVVLLAGLAVMAVANAYVVRSLVRPLDTLVDRLDRDLAASPSERLPVADGIAGRVTGAVNDLLARIDAGQRAAGASALAAQEAERARIAQELHDGVGQSLTVILLEAGRLADADVVTGDDAARIRETARHSLEEVRRVARQLRPHVLEDLGLASALSALVGDVFGHTDVQARRTVSPAVPPLPDEVELVVFRVAQEALTNVARHAGARRVEVGLTPQGDCVVLTVEDDGHGIDDLADGTGLRGMRERAALVGGELDVRRRGEGGTRVRLMVPAS